MVICMAVDCKSDSRPKFLVGLCFYKFLRDSNLKQQWLIKIKGRNIYSRYNMSECVRLITSAKIAGGKRCDFNWP